MKILIEGLPGTKKDLIFNFLEDKYRVEINRLRWGPACHHHYINNNTHDIFPMESELLVQAKEKEDKFIIHESQYSINNVYVPFYYENRDDSEDHQVDLLKNMEKLLLKDADVIIYLFGDLDKCYERYVEKVNNGSGLFGPRLAMSKTSFTNLYSKYEWAFDSHNCNINLYKINVEEDFEMVVASILNILKQIVKSKDKLIWNFS